MANTNLGFNVRDIFEEAKAKAEKKETPKKSNPWKKLDGEISGGDILRPGIRPIFPKHEEDNIDRIVKKYGQGSGYAKWQKERYPIRVDRTDWKKVF